ncbi:unnamed protein product [Vicia faba]|uniref:Trichome birefringence-like N-terminal domain-containing protein n=1 Tax=Vicia faba TaxID=3906 RepID=A0AAV0Z5E8_VICFA|nr:unnamed protein product [Vicia faba]
MKFQAMEVLFGKNTPKQMIPKVTLLAIFAILVFTVTPLSYPLFRYSSTVKSVKDIKQQPSSAFDDLNESSSLPSTSIKKCDIFNGEWVPNPNAPYYTNKTCWAIHEHQNCMKYGRPDSEFLKWKWRPFACELPVFNPFQFLEIVRGKSMAFVGDSVGRNQMQSMICLLSRVEWPIVVSHRQNDYFMVWKYPTYNFTLSSFWTPHLVKSKESDQKGPTSTGLFNLYIDEPDESWITEIEDFDYVILNGGHWFTRSMVYHENQKIVGCHYCLLENVPDLTMYHGYRRAFRTAFKAINNLKNFKGITFLRTFSPSHFENGIWNQGGNCVRRKPFRSNETELEGVSLEFYMIQLEEFKLAEKEGRRNGKKFRLYDVTQATLLRPDGHPSRFGHWPNDNVTLYNDCVHWCLPGPIDTWSDFLLDMLKMEGVRSAEERRLQLKNN